MKSLANKLIIYDSNCKVCSSLRDVVLRFTSIPEAKVKAYKDLNDHLSVQIDPDKFKNVMALIDTTGGQTIYGAEGVAFIFSSQYRVVDFLFRFKPFFTLFSLLYKTQAYNRYVMATPKNNFKCDCFPDRVVKYRISYIVITLLISILLTALFGLSLKNLFHDISNTEAAMQMLLMAGSGWVLQILLAIMILRDKALDYIGHLGSIMVVGLLILVPSMLFTFFTGIATPWIPAISVMLSSGYMLFLHINRIRYLELSQGCTISWFLLLQSTALFWVYFFHLRPSFMSLLKRLPIHYRGELHDVRLVNFSVPMEEVAGMVPANIKVRDFNGRAMISMVDVKLKNMRPVAFPFIRFNYRHVAFRLLVDDSYHNGGSHKGIFFFRSFSNNPLIVFGGTLMTDYNLEVANIQEQGNEVTITQGNKKIKYCLDRLTPVTNAELKSTIGALDRAYSVLGNTVRVTQIQREKWPIQFVNCSAFENTFFKSAKLEGAFRVAETIDYDWLPPKAIPACG